MGRRAGNFGGNNTSGDSAQWLAGMVSELTYDFVTAPLTMTDALQADGFIMADSSYVKRVDLQGMVEVRLTAKVKTDSASANSPKLQVRAQLTYSATVANYLIMGATSVEISLFTGQAAAGVSDSGWISLLPAYRVPNVFIGLMNIGGDGAADPVVNQVSVSFR